MYTSIHKEWYIYLVNQGLKLIKTKLIFYKRKSNIIEQISLLIRKILKICALFIFWVIEVNCAREADEENQEKPRKKYF